MNKRVLALFLCCALVFGMVPVALSAAFSTGSDFTICDSSGAPADSITLPQNDKTTLTAVAETDAGHYQWQIRVSDSVWANIAGSTEPTLELSYAMVASLLKENSVDIRCRLTNDVNNVTYSNIAAVTVEAAQLRAAAKRAPAFGSVISGAEPIGEPVISEASDFVQSSPAGAPAVQNEEAPATETPAQNEEAPTASNDVPALEPEANDGGSTNEEPPAPAPATSTFIIEIKYQFADGRQAANPWTATIATGQTYQQEVKSPVVLGYKPSQETVQVNASEGTTYTVTYYAAEVDYTVKHLQQNVENDEYTLVDTETKTGFTENEVGNELAKAYTGFYSLLYDTTTTIAADGSTNVEVYYDRYYYLMSFNLDGGYGVEPIYARYGAKIEVGTPTKPGYTFAGWGEEIPETMPAENTSFTANWIAGDAAKVTIVVWGENADDEQYSFYHNSEIMAKPGEKLTLEGLQGKLICGKEEHAHSDSCGIKCGHTHSLTCYGLRANTSATSPNNNTAWWCDSKPETYFAQLGLENGCLYYDDENARYDSKNNYYLRFDGKYYKLSEDQFNKLKGSEISNTSDNTSGNPDYYYKYSIKASGMSCTHTHDDSCYACGKPEHKHTSACYYNTSFMEKPELWKLVDSDEVTVAADGTTIINVYYDRVEFTLHFRKAESYSDDYGTIKAKWGANIRDQFNAKSSQAGTYSWSENRDASQPWTSYLDIMPEKNMTFYAYKTSGKSTAYYYVEGLDGKDKLYYESVASGTSLNVTEEEFIKIDGFTFNEERSTKKGNPFNNATFYYTRNSYTLKFFNRTEELTDKAKTVKYEAPLKDHYFEPAYPSDLEPNAYVFAGWYTTAGCYDGSEADLETMTMPASDVILYAKWTPKFHTVKTYLTKDAMDNDGEPLYTKDKVPHGTAIAESERPGTPENGQYTFVGWFYTGDDGKEKAFDFSMPVNRDLNLYAKWISNTLVEYTIRYQLEDGTEIAAPTKGSGLAGTTRTFDAKTGKELNDGYQSGYFPKTASHSLTIDIAGTAENKKNEFIFVYVAEPEVNYTVRYLEKDTNTVLHEEKHAATSDAVITEKFEQISGYAPDAYQKRLVLSADEKNNVITFWYVKDELHAPVQIIHWMQNTAGDGYTEYSSATNLNGEIGQEQTSTAIAIAGCRYTKGTAVAGETTSTFTAPNTPKAYLGTEGLVLNLYYDRIEYPYEFRFLEQGTETKLADPVKGNARYGAQVTQEAKDIPGYTRASITPDQQNLTIGIEDPADVASKNVKTFYYVEDTVNIKYQVVGPTGSGTLGNYQDNLVGVLTGKIANTEEYLKGSAPTAADGFKFVGWFKDEACTQPVEKTWVNADNKLTPQKTKDYGSGNMGYEAATYYAKFELDVADLTIQKTGCQDIDENQSFLFDVTSPDGYSKRVVIEGNGSVTISGLKIGTYTVTEVTNWSWRYNPDSVSKTITLEPAATNEATFANTRTVGKWLGGDAYSKNVFGSTN